MKQQEILISKDVFKTFKDEAIKCKESDKETLCYFMGKRNNGNIEISEIIPAGEHSEASVCHVAPDYLFMANSIMKYKEKGLLHLADGHSHLGYGSNLSSGDKNTFKRIAKNTPDFLQFLINVKEDNSTEFSVFSYDKKVGVIQRDWKLIEKEKSKTEPFFDRVKELYNPLILKKKKVLLIGAGSGGSSVFNFISRLGIGKIGVIDKRNEKLEKENIVRHLLNREYLGRKKAKALVQYGKLITKKTKFKKYLFDVEKKERKLRKLINKYDLIVSCTGFPNANNIINKISVEENKVCIFAAVFPKASGGYVFKYDPSKPENGCFNCFRDYQKISISDDKESEKELQKNYGFSPKEFQALTGCFIDISFIANLQSKYALLILLEGQKHEFGELKSNFILWDSVRMESIKINLKQREDCCICNEEVYLKDQENKFSKEVQSGI